MKATEVSSVCVFEGRNEQATDASREFRPDQPPQLVVKGPVTHDSCKWHVSRSMR